MKTKEWLHKRLPLLALILSLVLFVLSMASGNSDGNTEEIAEETAGRIEKRLAVLDKYLEEARNADKDQIMLLEGLPDDMVIYRYINDTLQSWNNQFSLINDDISTRMMFPVLTDRSSRIASYLTDVGDGIWSSP